MRKILPIALAVTFVVTVAPSTALAWVVPTPAPDTPDRLVLDVDGMGLMQPTPRAWAPRGKLVVDSGFRPNRDGLGMLNWPNSAEGPSSFPIQVSHYYLGYPLRTPIDLRPSDTARVLGRDQACVTTHPSKRSAECMLTQTARLWQDGVNAAMAGGHCFGIATTVAQIFNGDIPKSAIGAQTTPYRAPWSSKLMRQVARAWATQEVIDLTEYTQTPRDVVRLLKANLRKGKTPYVATIYSATGDGHAVTPIALYDRGKGRYDVAVYDNNYPGRTRAFHIDTRKNTFNYLISTVPGGAPMMATGNIQLVPASDLLPSALPCAFCAGGGETNVSIDPIGTRARVTVKVTAPDGSPIRGLKVIRPTNPSSIHGYRSFPTYVVPAKTAFRVSLASPTSPTSLDATVRITSGPAHFSPEVEVRPAGTTSLDYTPQGERATVTLRGTAGTSAQWRVADVIGATEWIFDAISADVRAGKKVSMTLDPRAYTLTMSRTGNQRQPVQIVADVMGGNGNGLALATLDAWQAGERIEITYRRWSGPGVKGLRGETITRDGTRTRLTFADWRP